MNNNNYFEELLNEVLQSHGIHNRIFQYTKTHLGYLIEFVGEKENYEVTNSEIFGYLHKQNYE